MSRHAAACMPAVYMALCYLSALLVAPALRAAAALDTASVSPSSMASQARRSAKNCRAAPGSAMASCSICQASQRCLKSSRVAMYSLETGGQRAGQAACTAESGGAGTGAWRAHGNTRTQCLRQAETAPRWRRAPPRHWQAAASQTATRSACPCPAQAAQCQQPQTFATCRHQRWLDALLAAASLQQPAPAGALGRCRTHLGQPQSLPLHWPTWQRHERVLPAAARRQPRQLARWGARRGQSGLSWTAARRLARPLQHRATALQR